MDKPAPVASRTRESFPDRVRLPLAFDPEPLAASIRALGKAAWSDHFVPDHYEGDWSILTLRAGPGATHPARMIFCDSSVSAYVDTPALAALPAFRAVLDLFPCGLKAVRLMRLAPGSAIKPHRDNHLRAEEGLARLHLPIVTSPEVDFRLNGRAVAMPAGSVWYLRLADRHEVINRGSCDRVHLVIDAIVDGWLRHMLRMGTQA